MGIRTRRFHSPQTGAIWETRTEGCDVTIRSGKPGKEKVALKPQSDALATRRFLDKEEGAKLRKGFILSQQQALPGEPLMLRFLSKGYTGAMSLAFHESKILVNQFGEDRDSLWFVDRQGEGGPICALNDPRLVWKIVPVPDLKTFLLRADHQVSSWNPATRELAALTEPNPRLVSDLDCAGHVAVWYEEPEIVVRDLELGSDLFRQPVEPTLYSGHSLQLAATLSADAHLLAYCAEPGVIVVRDLASGAADLVLKGEFAMVSQLAFTPDAERLIVKEQYGRWSLFSFELATGRPSPGWPDFGDLGNGQFSLHPSGHWLALGVRDKARIYDSASLDLLREFSVDHCVKRFALAWTDDDLLAIRTDLGVVGLYVP